MRVCVKCGVPKELEDFYIAWGALENRERQCKSCRRAHVKEYRENNVDKERKRIKKWHRKNPSKGKYYESNRRALKNNASIGLVDYGELLAMNVKNNGKLTCVYCHRGIRGAYHVDHIIPLSRGGSHSMDNLAIACPACNLAKSNKLLSEWKPE